jgi:hypothetical protein
MYEAEIFLVIEREFVWFQAMKPGKLGRSHRDAGSQITLPHPEAPGDLGESQLPIAILKSGFGPDFICNILDNRDQVFRALATIAHEGSMQLPPKDGSIFSDASTFENMRGKLACKKPVVQIQGPVPVLRMHKPRQ